MSDPKPRKKIPTNIPQLVSAEPEGGITPASKKEIADRKLEANRVLKRLLGIVEEHYRASLGLGRLATQPDSSIDSEDLRLEKRIDSGSVSKRTSIIDSGRCH